MADPDLTVHDSGGTEIPDGTPLALPDATAGTPSTATAFSLRNNDAAGPAVDPARNVKLTLTGRTAGSAAEPAADGLAFLEQHALQFRVTSVTGGATAAVIEWTPTGTSRAISLGEIPDGGVVNMEVRTRAPLAAALSDVEVFLAFESIQSTAMATGAYEAHGNYVYDGQPGGLPDPSFTEVYSISGSLAPDAPNDDSVDIWTSVVYTLEGVPQTFDPSPAEIVFNDVDGDTATLASGEAYYAAITLDGADTPNVTKGSKATAPLTDSDKPTPPTGELLAGWVVVPFGLVIDTVDDVLAPGFFGLTVVSGLTVSIGRGQAAVGGRWVDTQTATSTTLADSSTLTVYRQPETGLEVIASSSDPTDPLSMPIWDVTTSGGAVTATTDRRRIGNERRGGTLWGASFTVNAPAAGVQTVNVQLEDGLAQAVTEAHAVEWYLADDDAGLTPSTSAPDGGVAAGTDGALIEYVADLSGRMISEVDGDVDFVVTSSVSAATWYLVVVAAGRRSISGAITPTP